MSVISKSLKECMKLNWNFRGVGDGVWIISGITHTRRWGGGGGEWMAFLYTIPIPCSLSHPAIFVESCSFSEHLGISHLL